MAGWYFIPLMVLCAIPVVICVVCIMIDTVLNLSYWFRYREEDRAEKMKEIVDNVNDQWYLECVE